MIRCDNDRHAQGPDGFVFDDAFDEFTLDPMTDEERRLLFDEVRT